MDIMTKDDSANLTLKRLTKAKLKARGIGECSEPTMDDRTRIGQKEKTVKGHMGYKVYRIKFRFSEYFNAFKR